MTRPKADRQQTTHSRWTESRYDTRVALERASSCAKQLRRWWICADLSKSAPSSGSMADVVGVGSDSIFSPHIDPCFPWARLAEQLVEWRSLESLAGREQYQSQGRFKSDRKSLPASGAMADARGRMLEWWQNAWVGSSREAQFFMEARYSLPGIFDDSPEQGQERVG